MSYLNFTEMQDSKRKTKQWYISNINNGSILGYISFYPQWRKYIFIPDQRVNAIYDTKCLGEIIEFLNKVNEERKNEPT